MWPFNKKKGRDSLDKERLVAFGQLAIVSSQCIGPERLPVLHGIREHPNNSSDSGWMLSSGRESTKFSSDANNFKLVPFERMIDADNTLAPLRDFPVGIQITRRDITEPWRFIVDDKVVDADGKLLEG